MKAIIHYALKLKLIRISAQGEIDFIEYDEKFENEDPIIARTQAFDAFHNCLTSILKAKNKSYSTDKQARSEIRQFAENTINSKVVFANREIDFSSTIGNGIGVFMIIDHPLDGYVIEDHAGDEYMIHGMGGFGWADDPKSIMSALAHEYWYYNQRKLNHKDLKRTISFYEYDIAQAEPNIILETPFDWTGYNKPYSSMYYELGFHSAEQAFLDNLIKKGECSQVEFKPSLLFNHKTGKGGISIKGIIAKTICAFLNSNGGFLFIGITNKGEVQGLNFDYSLSTAKNNRDFFQLEFDQMIEHFLSLSIKSNVSGQFYEYDGKDLYVVTVLPSRHRPIFLNGQEGKEFFVRIDSSSRHMSDIEEIANYCIDTWTN